jgi:uncharacterized membrane protein YdbT with pleckstrin-like domain
VTGRTIARMPYPRRLLHDDEHLDLDLQPHWWFFARQIGASIPLLIVVVVILAATSDSLRSVLFAIWGVATLIWAGWLGIKYLDWRFTHFVVTDQRVVFRTGVLAKRGVEIPLNRINNINFRQGIWERVIGAGDLEIESAGKDGQSVFEAVRHPDAVQHEIYDMIAKDEQRRASWAAPGAPGAPGAVPGADTSVPHQLEQLAALRDRGVITQAEFDAKKAELLGRM